MTTPNRETIVQRAKELWHEDRAKHGDPSFDVEPEIDELRENGFLNVAQSELMRSGTNTDEWKNYCGTIQKLERPKEDHTENFIKTGVPFDVTLALDSGFYVSGTSQSGKTNLAKHLVQKLMQHGIVVHVLDSSRAWTRNSPITNIVEVDTDTDEYTVGNSTIFDISALNTRQKVWFVNGFCGNVYRHHVDGYKVREFVIFEEAQLYLPQGSMRLAIRRSSPCESVLDVVTVGANYGLRFGLITQFPALVDKAPVKICQQRYFGWTWEKNDVQYLKGFIPKEWIEKLNALQKGRFIYQNRDKIDLIQTSIFGEHTNHEEQEFNFAWQFEPLVTTERFK